jgi:hypothetical protein
VPCPGAPHAVLSQARVTARSSVTVAGRRQRLPTSTYKAAWRQGLLVGEVVRRWRPFREWNGNVRAGRGGCRGPRRQGLHLERLCPVDLQPWGRRTSPTLRATDELDNGSSTVVAMSPYVITRPVWMVETTRSTSSRNEVLGTVGRRNRRIAVEDVSCPAQSESSRVPFPVSDDADSLVRPLVIEVVERDRGRSAVANARLLIEPDRQTCIRHRSVEVSSFVDGHDRMLALTHSLGAICLELRGRATSRGSSSRSGR